MWTYTTLFSLYCYNRLWDVFSFISLFSVFDYTNIKAFISPPLLATHHPSNKNEDKRYNRQNENRQGIKRPLFLSSLDKYSQFIKHWNMQSRIQILPILSIHLPSCLTKNPSVMQREILDGKESMRKKVLSIPIPLLNIHVYWLDELFSFAFSPFAYQLARFYSLVSCWDLRCVKSDRLNWHITQLCKVFFWILKLHNTSVALQWLLLNFLKSFYRLC